VGRLFGSSIKDHSSTVLLYIRRAEISHELSADRVFGWNEIIEIELSQAQFAELLTTMNQGTGVPCTIRRKDGQKIEDPPESFVEAERVREGFDDGLKELTTYITKQIEELEIALNETKLSRKAKEKIMWILGKTLQEVESNWPFVLKQFNRATDRIVVAAKSEVDAFVTHVVQQTGLEQLQKLKMLEDPKDDKDD
jgi:hypothetical protein